VSGGVPAVGGAAGAGFGLGAGSIVTQYLSIGIKLTITPYINADGFVTAEIKPEVSSLKGWRGLYNEIPWIATRRAETTVTIKDGETIVIGGLISAEERETISKVPFLGDLPLVGVLFRSKRKDKTKSEIIISVTPHVLPEQPKKP